MQAYQKLVGPLTPHRADWRAALVASMVANANRDAKKHPRPYSPEEFIPDWEKAAGVKRPLTPREVADKAKAAFRGLAAKSKGFQR